MRRERDARVSASKVALVLGLVGASSVAAVGMGVHATMAVEPRRSAPVELVTRTGAPGRVDAVVEHSLTMTHSYMSLGTPSELVRERVLSPELARALGKDGRTLVANLLDRAYEVMAYERSRRFSREAFFHALSDVNAMLAGRELGYYLYAEFWWSPGYQRVNQVMLENFAITRANAYRAGARTMRALHVRRLGAPRVQTGRLGFTAIEYPEVFILPEQIDDELRVGLWPARDPQGATELFWVADEERRSPWYGALRRAVAAAMDQELSALVASRQPGLRRAALGAAMVRAVELHELQHQLDFAAKLPLRGLFAELGDRLGDKRLARSCMFETSAHLAQLARAPELSRTILAEIASYAFSEQCRDADCLAALIILDEIGAELGIAQNDSLIAGTSYELEGVGRRYVPIADHPSHAVSAAAGRAWERLFDARLVPVEPVTSARAQ